ncbi:MAG: exodeoxyribonuclease V subunit gamma, partial [Desulfamplus sp.]|nr:exodeoxyribonuclease V subunit gamma [Desulfamplus sp.]
MFYIYSSNRLQHLAIQLAREIHPANKTISTNKTTSPFNGSLFKTIGPPQEDNIFEPEIVVLQSQGMERWLKLEIAGINSICANLWSPFPKTFLMHCLEKTTGIPQGNLFSREVLLWRIYSLLGSQENLLDPRFHPLKKYLEGDEHDLKQYQLSERLALLYDQYLTFRPATIMSWSGYKRDEIPFSEPLIKTDDPRVGHHALWQKLLWEKLYESAPEGTLLNRLARFLMSDISQWKAVLPKKVHLFGMSSIPLQFMLFFEKLSQVTDVHLYYLSPCQEFWEDCVREKTRLAMDIRAESRAGSHALSSGESLLGEASVYDDLYWEVGNPLLSSMGISARDFSRAVTSLEGAQEPLWCDDIFKFQPSMTPLERENLLHRIQNDILFLRDGLKEAQTHGDGDYGEGTYNNGAHDDGAYNNGAHGDEVNDDGAHGDEVHDDGAHDDEVHDDGAHDDGAHDDRSLSIHICHSPMREVEVLHDQLIDMMNEDATLTPRDILVMAPDIAAFAPYIKAVFDNPETAALKIPFSIADRMPGQDNPVASAFLMLLSLPGTRFTSVEIMEILQVEAVHRRFGLDTKALDIIRRWIGESGIRWGIDTDFKVDSGIPPRHENTWVFGFDRMLMGCAVPGSQGIVHDIFPLDIEGGDSEIAGRFMGFFDKIMDFFQEIERIQHLPGNNMKNPGMDGAPTPSPGADKWEALFIRGMDTFFEETPETEAHLQDLCLGVNVLFETIRSSKAEASIGLDALLCGLKGLLQDDTGSRGFLHGGVTFCRFRPMRSIPSKVICLMGMDEDAWPTKGNKNAFDLMAAAPAPGDNSSRIEERYLFLEALLSARDKLYISYVGRSIRDNSPIPPSVLVSELIDYIGEKADDLITVHPLQAFSRRYFDGSHSRLFSYSMLNCKGAGNIYAREGKNISSGEIFSDVGTKKVDAGTKEADAGAKESKKEADGVREIDIQNLIRFFANPCRYYMREILGINLQKDELPMPETDEPFEWEERDYFRDSALLDQMLETITMFDPAPIHERFMAQGTMPSGSMEKRRFEKHFHLLKEFADTVITHRDGRKNRPYQFSISLSSGTTSFYIYGTVQGYYENFGIINHKFAKSKHKLYLQTWIEALVLKLLETEFCKAVIIHRNPKNGEPPMVGKFDIPPHGECEKYLRSLC